MPSSTCPLCGAQLGEVLLTILEPDRFERAVGIAGGDGYRRLWCGCTGCGAAIQQQDSLNAERLRAIAENYYEVDLANGIESKYRLVMDLPDNRSDNAGRVSRVLEKLLTVRAALGIAPETVIRAVDVGAGTGVFLAKLALACAAKGIALEAVAIEPDPIAAAHLRSLGIASVKEAVLDRTFEGADFDLVTFNKVLEHIDDPVPVLKEAARLLSPERGLIYAEVPAVETIGRRPATDNILGALHRHLYGLSSVDRMLSRAALVPVDLRRIAEPSGKLTVFGFAVPTPLFDKLASKQVS